MNLGQKIQSLREYHGFRIQEFAVALRTSPRMIQRLENNEFKFVRQRWLQTIASLTGNEASEIHKDCVHYYDPAQQSYVLRDEDVNPSEES